MPTRFFNYEVFTNDTLAIEHQVLNANSQPVVLNNHSFVFGVAEDQDNSTVLTLSSANTAQINIANVDTGRIVIYFKPSDNVFSRANETYIYQVRMSSNNVNETILAGNMKIIKSIFPNS